MASTTPTPASPWRILKLCWLAVFAPAHFEELERQDKIVLDSYKQPTPILGIQSVRQAFGYSAVWGASAAIVGALLGWATAWLLEPGSFALAFAASLGTGILLWATLALKGWDIQTWGGVSLTERVNRWWFRGLYWIGTMLVVMAAIWGVR
ncbi:hypothetical protein [Mesorhizobium sp. M1E.F.Ca.ET.063.01.1.1]|uniref:hypothetical protein n=1 Tax=Mesorhizobium sp. M1E.F.Ca.ET.063.01.1.1 TaxID=2496750 RepID=UPI000FCC68B5|nr:hypothetical protein [Mesorhizobium sp. M1E.F.Ca.ET.063.01.1.1]RUW85198.1 hypothetical protein EOA29_05955 [Mesorhizobium sp. M1E.F.Ca.ET.063.01.1.1]